MLFNSYHFFVFLTIVLILTNLFQWRSTAQKVILLLSCYYFYGQWSWYYLCLILTTTTVDFLVALKMSQKYNPRLMLLTSLFINLGILSFFKYVNFIISTTNSLSGLTGNIWHFSSIDILLPIGISFYTFQSIGYVIDVYRGDTQSRRSFIDYALFVAFFTHLAGPIIRANKFFEQLDSRTKPSFLDVQDGFSMILFGLVKKMVFADNLAILASQVFDAPSGLSGWHTLLGVYAFTFQIYFDFSGYSDMAIGVSRLFGFSFPKNFDYPYLASGFQEFWRRWHISLSTWLRDYLYISLGGSRLDGLRTAGNIMITMLLGGLWHGASWNFVLWGSLHGAYLLIERGMKAFYPGFWESRSYPVIFLRWLITFNVVALTWIFFRSQSFANSMQIFKNLLTILENIQSEMIMNVGLLLVFLMALHWISNYIAWKDRLSNLSSPVIITAYFIALLSLVIFYPKTSAPFIYFKF